MHIKYNKIISLVCIFLTIATLSSCVVNPPPAVEYPNISSSFLTKKTQNELVFGIQDLGLGFNPHIKSHLSEINKITASLTLPSVYKIQNDQKNYSLNRNLIKEIKLIKQKNELIIQYSIEKDAQWSDSAPITGEDFFYLWKKIINSHESLDKDLYSHIQKINSKNSGKNVLVYVDSYKFNWKKLFSNLLPSHLVKTIPGGFENGFDKKSNMLIPAAGGKYKFKNIDWQRGELILERNDRFWKKTTPIKKIIFKVIDNSKLIKSAFKGESLNMGIFEEKNVSFIELTNLQFEYMRTNPIKNQQIFLNTKSDLFNTIEKRKVFFDNYFIKIDQNLKNRKAKKELNIAVQEGDTQSISTFNKYKNYFNKDFSINLIELNHNILYSDKNSNLKIDLSIVRDNFLSNKNSNIYSFTCNKYSKKEDHFQNLSQYCLPKKILNNNMSEQILKNKFIYFSFPDPINYLISKPDNEVNFVLEEIN